METAKLFQKCAFPCAFRRRGVALQNGKSQAVRLPKKYRFSGDRGFLKRMGNAVVLLPYEDPWETLIASVEQFSDDFLSQQQLPN